MDEFGHHAKIASGICIDAWGSGPFLIRDGDGKLSCFEDSDRFGPFRCNMKGVIPKDDSWPERSKFWIAHRCWRAQGRRVEPDGVTCVWDHPKPTVVRHLSGRSYMVVEHGEDDGGIVDEDGRDVRSKGRITMFPRILVERASP